jgi:uncharacterized protein YozE (UPF0346 family)
MSTKETKLIMDLCYQMFQHYPKTVADFAGFINYLETRADGE